LEAHQQQRREYESKRKKRRSILAALKKREHSTKSKLDRLLADQRNLERLTNQMGDIVERKAITPASGMGFAKLKGSLPWPVSGRLLARYGRPRLGSGQLTWRGLLIEATEGDEVASVADGRVVFSDWLRGYGYVVIVDHGNNYLSLYGHNQALFRDVGENVKKGDILALVGQTGSNNVPALYFEIRHRGDPVNPQRWIQAKR
jgi:septal ring factor EnvC (AmiA/AmiB activator)